MGILVMSIPFDCSLLVSLFFHLEPICEPKSGQLKTDPARSPLPVTQPQLHIQVSFCQSMNLIWTHEFDKSDKIKRSLYLVHYIYFFPTDFAFCFDLGTYSKWIFVWDPKQTKKWSYNSLLSKQAANFLNFFRIRRLGVLSDDQDIDRYLYSHTFQATSCILYCMIEYRSENPLCCYIYSQVHKDNIHTT